MDYLVTMTTHVPAGVSTEDVAEVRAHEAAHTQTLAREGRVLRLWRPPLQPGEWRTIGLFVAEDPAELERTLASMPLRVWRSDEVTPLGAHPNDPGRGRIAIRPGDKEFLTTLVVTIPEATSSSVVDTQLAREAARARELAEAGRLIRLWTLPGTGRNLGDWQTGNERQMRDILQSLPLANWLAVDTLPVTRHPSDPAIIGVETSQPSQR